MRLNRQGPSLATRWLARQSGAASEAHLPSIVRRGSAISALPLPGGKPCELTRHRKPLTNRLLVRSMQAMGLPMDSGEQSI